MNGCEIYQIKPLIRFTESYELLIKNHYSRRQHKKLREQFEEQVFHLIHTIAEKPRNNGSNIEAFPKDSFHEGIEFRKLRFKPCGLEGFSSRCGRLMYVVCDFHCIVYLNWIYTHEEFGKKGATRPPDNQLKQDFDIIRADILQTSELTNK